MTKAAQTFYKQETKKEKEGAVVGDGEVVLPNAVKVFSDDDEWSSWKKISDEVLHIEVSSLVFCGARVYS